MRHREQPLRDHRDRPKERSHPQTVSLKPPIRSPLFPTAHSHRATNHWTYDLLKPESSQYGCPAQHGDPIDDSQISDVALHLEDVFTTNWTNVTNRHRARVSCGKGIDIYSILCEESFQASMGAERMPLAQIRRTWRGEPGRIMKF